MNKGCRNDTMSTSPNTFPRSCSRCGHGPCMNLDNKPIHDAFIPTYNYQKMYKHVDQQILDTTPPADQLGDEIKVLEGAYEQRVALPGQFLMARADGRAFHTFTRDLQRPFDQHMSDAMLFTTQQLCRLFNARLGYTQSDEITLAFYYEGESDFPFGGRLQKMCSLIAAQATALFNLKVVETMPHKASEMPIFDCRVFKTITLATTIDSFIWREKDASKNAVSMAASSVYAPKELLGVGTRERIKMLNAKGINFNDYPLHFKKGVYFHRQERRVLLDDLTLSKIPEGKAPPDGMIIRRSVEQAKFESLISLDEPTLEELFGVKGFTSKKE